MPTSTNEDDIRDFFSWDGCPQVKTIQKEVGNFWFVSLDGAHETIVETLLELKNKKFKGEHVVKARLKTESMSRPTAKNYYHAPSLIPPSTNSYPHEYTGYNHAMNMKHSNSNSNSNNHYNGTNGRSQHFRRSNNKYGSSDQYAYRNRYQLNASYANNSAPGKGRNNNYMSANNSYSGGKGRGYRSGSVGADDNAASGKRSDGKNPKKNFIPPSPLEMESHFPALGGGSTSGTGGKSSTSPKNVSDSSSAGVKHETSKESNGSKTKVKVPVVDGKESSAEQEKNNDDNIPSSNAKAVPMETKKSVSGYAAALLKAAPTPQSVVSGAASSQQVNKKQGKAQSNNVSSNAQNKTHKKFIVTVPLQKSNASTNNNNNNHHHQTTKDSKCAGSTATTASDPTDPFSDSSSSFTTAADDKSNSSYTSTSNVKDSEKNAVRSNGTNTVPAGWGGKKSFADILKIKEGHIKN